jgi:malate dehydrogenase
MMKEINVLVTGAAGQIGYALLTRLASGETFGKDTRVNLNLVEVPQVVSKLEGSKMELEDCGFNTLGEIKSFSDINEAAGDIDWALLVGSIPRGITINGKKIEERADLLKINGGIFTEQGKALGENAKQNAKILVVGNPANTNALIGCTHGNNSTQTWMAMTALDSNRAKAQVANKCNVEISDIKKMTIWGNHSPTMYPDLDNAEINNESVSALINDKDWIENDFLQIVQQRGKAIIDARGASSATSAANAAIDTVKATLSETAENDWFSAAVMSDGSYNVPEGIIFGFPLRASSSGEITIVQNLPISEYAQNKINLTTQELLDEKKDISDLL